MENTNILRGVAKFKPTFCNLLFNLLAYTRKIDRTYILYETDHCGKVQG